MNYRQLGKSAVKVSEIGFGTWEIGGMSWVAPSADECIALLRRAFDLGVNLFDVAPSYGNGRSEILVGKAFRGKRDQVIISAKLGIVEDGTYQGRWSKRELLETLNNSLIRLETDYVDILSLHLPPAGGMDILKAGYALELLCELKEQGKTRLVGVTMEAMPEEALIALYQGIDVLQPRFNLVFPEARRVFPVVTEKGAGLIINAPFAHGYLTGRYKTYDDIDEADYPKRQFKSAKPRELVEGMIKSANAFQALVGGSARSMTHAALKFILAHEVVSSTIPGHRRAAELEDNVAAADSTYFTGEELAKAEDIYHQEILREIS